MFFDIITSIHIESQLNIFCFINNVSSKMEFFAVSEILRGRNFMQNRNFMHTCIKAFLQDSLSNAMPQFDKIEKGMRVYR
jgi:hypothetical protein